MCQFKGAAADDRLYIWGRRSEPTKSGEEWQVGEIKRVTANEKCASSLTSEGCKFPEAAAGCVLKLPGRRRYGGELISEGGTEGQKEAAVRTRLMANKKYVTMAKGEAYAVNHARNVHRERVVAVYPHTPGTRLHLRSQEVKQAYAR